VILVNAKVPQTHGTASHWKIAQREFDFGGSPDHVIVVIVPPEDAEFISIETGERCHIGLRPHTVLQHHIEGNGAIALNDNTLSAQAAEHAKDIEHQLIQS